MIGIYQDTFIDYLKSALGDNIKTTAKNIIAPCPWCEYQVEKNHYHLYISLEVPIFHCFHAVCEQRGTLRKLFSKIEGKDISDNFVDQEKLKEYKKKQIFTERETKIVITLPQVSVNQFPHKESYLKKRLKFSNIPIQSLKGLVFDVHEFINSNQIPVNEPLFRIRDYLHNNFIGFLTEQNSMVMFRNIDDEADFRFFKLFIQKTPFVDYYKLNGPAKHGKQIVLAEGIYDIFTEHIFDNLNIKKDTALYASVQSSNYSMIVKSIVFNEQIFRPDVIILSDNGIELSQYENLYTFNSHIINSLKVYYNKTGKDFNDSPLTPVEYIIKKRRYKRNGRICKR